MYLPIFFRVASLALYNYLDASDVNLMGMAAIDQGPVSV